MLLSTDIFQGPAVSGRTDLAALQPISGVRVEHLPKIVILELFAKMSENVTLLNLGVRARVIILQCILLYTVISITL